MKRRVVVTGMGIKSSIGNSIFSFLESLKKGTNGIKPISFVDVSDLEVKVASYDYEFDPNEYFSKKDIRKTDRFCQLAVAASKDALNGQNMLEYYDEYKIGVIYSSGIGGMNTIEKEHSRLMEKGVGAVSVFLIPMMISNMAAGLISIDTGFKGDSFSISTACASSSNAIGETFRKIRDGYLDAAITGGAESGISRFTLAGFNNMRALTTEKNPDKASIPFDKNRSGFVMGEGAGALLLEELESAKKRGAKIYGEIVGYGATSDAYHITKPDIDGKAQAQAILTAVQDAKISCDMIDYVNAHGTSTQINDVTETKAIKRAFSEHAKNLLISSTKSMTGHMLGAAGVVEAIVTILALQNGFIPPTIGLVEKDQECDLFYTPQKSLQKEIQYAISSSFGFGGHNAVLCFKKYEE